MPICRKCGSYFPNRIVVEGKQRNLCKRKYCLECSPFGSHNTRNHEKAQKKYVDDHKTCKICGQEYYGCRSNICSTCTIRRRRSLIRERMFGVVGNKCFICGYGNEDTQSVMEFHHVHPNEKLFAINIANATSHSWDKVLDEIKKCVLLCCRCHREFHAGLISQDDIESKYRSFWENYNSF